MPPQVMFVQDIIESNGKTVKENNLQKVHKYPIGTMIKYELKHIDHIENHGTDKEICMGIHGTLCGFILTHDRDCDGTPLYTIGTDSPSYRDTVIEMLHLDITKSIHRSIADSMCHAYSGIAEEDLLIMTHENNNWPE